MVRWFILAALLALPALLGAPVLAADRSVAVGSFDRIRIDGPFDVRLTTRATPNATVSGDARVLDTVAVRVEGGTLVVRRNDTRWGERPVERGLGVPIVTLATRDLRSAGLVGSGRLTISGPLTAERLDLSLTGAGSIEATGVAGDALTATLIGDGTLTLGGTVRSARLSANGSGRIAAQGLSANDVVVRSDGSAAIAVAARYTASANSTGSGPIEILGRPECKVKAAGGGSIVCGQGRPDR